MKNIETTLRNLGTVSLVGAGPGDPELLTLKAAKAIAAATVLLVDDLVSADIVALASPTARVIHVGKRGGCKSTPQAFIEKLMVMAAREGETVVRLKGGDPFIFGRGGEEVEHLRAQGIAVQVINGITAGLAGLSSLGAPLTHREHAHGVIFITGHAKPGDADTDWRAIAATARDAKLTLVIYMGVRGAARIQDELLTGLPESTPVAVIQHVSLPTQRHAVTTLGQLQATIEREQLASPSVIVVGDVVRGVAAVSQATPAAARPDENVAASRSRNPARLVAAAGRPHHASRLRRGRPLCRQRPHTLPAMHSYDVVVIGAGAAGLFCAGVAGQLGLKVLVLDHSEKVAEKIRISGGGRCNFTNRQLDPAAPHKYFLGENPHFCRSALSRYTPQDFIALVQRHGIAFHEKHKGQLFCDRSAEDLIQMLLAECGAGAWRPG